jgi:hypothetical protein
VGDRVRLQTVRVLGALAVRLAPWPSSDRPVVALLRTCLRLGGACRSVGPCRTADALPFLCTQDAGHSGMHAAWDGYGCAESAWSQEWAW